MVEQFSETAALRIGLAARSLPDTDAARLMKVLVKVLGMPLTEEKLGRITARELQGGTDGEFAQVPLPAIKQALDCLWGKTSVQVDDRLPPVEGADPELTGAIRVAVASNSDELIDGHFGSCTRFLVYQVTPEACRLIDIRTPAPTGKADDKNAHRAALIRDCHVLYVVSIGGPAAAKVVKENIHPVKFPQGGAAREQIGAMQQVLGRNPPPWLARAMGAKDGLGRFLDGAQEAGC